MEIYNNVYKCMNQPKGCGSFGEVFQAVASDGRVIAVKRVLLGLKKNDDDDKRITNL